MVPSKGHCGGEGSLLVCIFNDGTAWRDCRSLVANWKRKLGQYIAITNAVEISKVSLTTVKPNCLFTLRERSEIKMISYEYRNSHYFSRSSYLYYRNPHTSKDGHYIETGPRYTGTQLSRNNADCKIGHNFVKIYFADHFIAFRCPRILRKSMTKSVLRVC